MKKMLFLLGIVQIHAADVFLEPYLGARAMMAKKSDFSYRGRLIKDFRFSQGDNFAGARLGFNVTPLVLVGFDLHISTGAFEISEKELTDQFVRSRILGTRKHSHRLEGGAFAGLRIPGLFFLAPENVKVFYKVSKMKSGDVAVDPDLKGSGFGFSLGFPFFFFPLVNVNLGADFVTYGESALKWAMEGVHVSLSVPLKIFWF